MWPEASCSHDVQWVKHPIGVHVFDMQPSPLHRKIPGEIVRANNVYDFTPGTTGMLLGFR